MWRNVYFTNYLNYYLTNYFLRTFFIQFQVIKLNIGWNRFARFALSRIRSWLIQRQRYHDLLLTSNMFVIYLQIQIEILRMDKSECDWYLVISKIVTRAIRAVPFVTCHDPRIRSGWFAKWMTIRNGILSKEDALASGICPIFAPLCYVEHV